MLTSQSVAHDKSRSQDCACSSRQHPRAAIDTRIDHQVSGMGALFGPAGCKAHLSKEPLKAYCRVWAM